MTQPNLPREINRVLEPSTAWKSLKALCDQNIARLGKSWNICNDAGAGVLFAKRRPPALVKIPGSWPLASVDKKNLRREVGLSYALFNARSRPIGHHQFISWETQLLRPVKRLPEILKIKCDLIAYNAVSKTLVAVEVKLNPDNDATSIQHGLLQAMTYAYVLQQCLRQDRIALERQVQNCLAHWLPLQPSRRVSVHKVAYALAAPKDYFARSLEMRRWVEKAVRIRDASFAGFWVLDHDEVEAQQDVGESRCIPVIQCDISRIPSVRRLAEFCDHDGARRA